jgi:hypothetical protein
MIFWLVLKLEILVIIELYSLEGFILVSFRGFLGRLYF